MVVPVLPSDDVHLYWVIATPPVAGAVQDTSSVVVPAVFALADGVGLDTVGEDMVAGTVVTVTEFDAEEDSPVPHSFVPETVNVGTAPEARPPMTIGEDDPVAVSPVDATTVNVSAAGEAAGNVKDTEAAPSSYALPVPTLVALTLTGACGNKKSFELCEFAPAFLPTAIYFSLIMYL